MGTKTELKAGDTVKAFGYEWEILVPQYHGIDGGVGVLCLAKTPIRNMVFSTDVVGNEYASSDIREYLEGDFTKHLERLGAEFNTMLLDTTAADGTGWEVPPLEIKGAFLLTDLMYRKYRRYITNKQDWWWTSTACSLDPYFTYWVQTVNADGTCGTLTARERASVIPACIFSSIPNREVQHSEKEIDELRRKITQLKKMVKKKKKKR